MSGLWLTAWATSAVSAVGALYFAKRAGLGKIERAIYAVPFFPAPVAVAVGGRNSFIYLFDLAVPFIVWAAARRWRSAAPGSRMVALMATFAIGLVPVYTAVFFGGASDVRFELIALYRTVGVMALLLVISSTESGVRTGRDWLIAGFSWLTCVLAIAMILEGHSIISSNLFYALSPSSSEVVPQVRYMAVGMFRASLGFVAMLGFAASLSLTRPRSIRQLRILAFVGGIAAAVIAVLTASKTTLIIILVLALIFLTVRPRYSAARWLGAFAVAAMVLLLASENFISGDPTVSRALGVLQLEESSLSTLRARQDLWAAGLEMIMRHPLTLLGVRPAGNTMTLADYHNEYLGVFFVGGLWSLLAYAAALLCLFSRLYRRGWSRRSVSHFAGLTFAGGLAQGLTVTHLNAGLFFIVPIALLMISYALGMQAAGPVAEYEGRAQFTTARA